MNQIDAYMKKHRFPVHLQNKMRFFYSKKFRKCYFKEEAILSNLSGRQFCVWFGSFRFFIPHSNILGDLVLFVKNLNRQVNRVIQKGSSIFRGGLKLWLKPYRTSFWTI